MRKTKESPACVHQSAKAYVLVSQARPFDRSTPGPVRPAPATGTHTDEVLAEAGFSADEIAALHAAGAAKRA